MCILCGEFFQKTVNIREILMKSWFGNFSNHVDLRVPVYAYVNALEDE